jgi:hypothetical protein
MSPSIILYANRPGTIGITEGIEKTSGGLFRMCAIWILIIPTAVAPRKEAKTIPTSKFMTVNLINPPTAPSMPMEKITRRGTLKRTANPIAAMPAQILFVIISRSIILEI